MTARQMALRLASALDNKKGLEVRVLDLRGVCGFADYFVLATGTSARHVRTLADGDGDRHVIVIDRDILSCPVAELRDVKVEYTVLGGKIVYQRPKPR